MSDALNTIIRQKAKILLLIWLKMDLLVLKKAD